MELTLRQYQSEALAALDEGWKQGKVRQAVILPTGCHRAGQGILMANGSIKAVENIRVGDQLMGTGNESRTVLSLIHGTGPMYEIRPIKGRSWVVNEDHVLTLIKVREKAGSPYPSHWGGRVVDVTVTEYLTWPRWKKHVYKLFRVGADFPVRPNPKIDPHFLGAILGDGTLATKYHMSMTTVDPEIIAEVHEQAVAWNLNVARDRITYGLRSRVRNGRGGSNMLIGELRHLGLSPIRGEDRFVPDDYKLGNREVRLQTLAGLLDSDGYLGNGVYEFSSKSQHLAEDAAFLARSLGLAAYIHERQNGVAKGQFRVSISGDVSVIPCRVARKRAAVREQKKDMLRTGFTVESTDVAESYFGFTLDGNGRYLLDDFTVTHNSGKTVIFSELSKQAHAQGQRPLILVHRDELVNQAADKIHNVMPHASVGIVKAEHNGVECDVIVGSVQTLARERRRDQLRNVGMLVVDEAHHALAPSYRSILTHYGAFSDRGTPTSGWTATLARGDGKGLGDVWEIVAYERDILWMIEHGYLVDVKGRAVTVDGLDLGTVARTRGDYQEGDLGDALLSVGAGEVIADAYREHAPTRQGVLFAPTVASAFAMAEDMNAAGILTETIIGMTDLDERAGIYDRYRDGKTQVLANCMVLTEGWDMPQASCAIIARPTSSASLYIQMVGRVLRPWPGKQDALVLDVVGVAGKHPLATLKDLSRTKVEPEEGETLTQAEQRIRQAGTKGENDGEIGSHVVDLFSRSHSAWLQTRAGIWFVPTRERLFFLWPRRNGKYDVGSCSNRTTSDGVWLAKDLDLDYAMAWAESAATEIDPSVSSRNASWRKRSQPPSEAQARVCRQVGIIVGRDDTKSDVSDKLSIHFASRLLDPVK